MRTLIERFWDKADCDTVDQCWIWMKARDADGYGGLRVNGKMEKAHRVAYILEIGEIPDDAEIHHKCENRACVNPYHLQAVTRKEHERISPNMPQNQRRNQNHCVNGHEYTIENTYRYLNGTRRCRQCNREQQKQFKIRRNSFALSDLDSRGFEHSPEESQTVLSIDGGSKSRHSLSWNFSPERLRAMREAIIK